MTERDPNVDWTVTVSLRSRRHVTYQQLIKLTRLGEQIVEGLIQTKSYHVQINVVVSFRPETVSSLIPVPNSKISSENNYIFTSHTDIR